MRLQGAILLVLSVLVIAPLRLMAANQLIGWGDGQNNQLGLAYNPVSNVPVALTNLGGLAGKNIVAVASSGNHTLVLLSDGTMYAWGHNNSGQFGNNSTTDSAVPVPVDTSGVLAGKTIKAISVGAFNSYALGTDGKVYAWGSNGNGQLGNNSTSESHTPVQVDTSGVLAGKTITAIAVGNSCAFALSSDGLVYSWGWNAGYQLGDGTNDFPDYHSVPVAVDTSTALAGKTVTAIAAGSGPVFALATDGHVYAWGSNGLAGGLGNNSTTDSNTPVSVYTSGVLSGKTIVQIAAGGYGGYALAASGELYSWGKNSYGQLGNGSFADSPVPVAVNTAGVLAGKTISALGTNWQTAYVLASDGTVYSWGSSILGALGITDASSSLNLPVAVDTSGPLAGTPVAKLQSGVGSNTFFVLAPVGLTVPNDFNGDGKADILLTNTVTGDRAIWLMNGTTISAGALLGVLPTSWTFSGVADFNGDGKADIVLTNTATGERAIWLMNGTTISAGASLGVLPTAWFISGTGDFNGDGKSDILLTNTVTGDRAVWLMNGTAISAGASLGLLSTNWVFSRVGDFDGDGKADIFLTNSVSGERAVWLMNGTVISAGASLGLVSTNWLITH